MLPEDALRPATDDTQPYEVLTVASLNSTDGTVNLWWGDRLIQGVPADTSYVNRKPGDVVRVDKGPLSWRVRGPVGPAADSGPVSWSQVLGKPDLAGITYGEGAPPVGYKAASAVFVKDNKVYVQVGAGGGSGGSPGGSVPDPVSVTPTARALYQGGHRTSAWHGGKPAQGSWGYNPANTGLWTYGSQVTAAAGKGTVAGISLWLARESGGGINGGVRPRLFLVSEGSPPYATPGLSSFWSPSRGLTKNDDYWYDLPASWVSALTSGSARGIAASAPTGTAYILYRPCGGLKVTYK